MTRRALIIGLGQPTRSLLETSRKVFEKHDHLEDVELLWLTPFFSEDSPPKELNAEPALKLSREKINQLYYQPEIRAMSAMNWKSWKKRIASNRLWGKLAAYYYLPDLQQRIFALGDKLASSDGTNVNYYLLAHLHDPFASGALLDCAYLLNHVTIRRRGSGRVYGILLLPGIAGDPVTAGDQPETNAQKLRQAICYASLRELEFALSERSFFANHHPAVTIEVTNESPFQTGDCYLIGGSRDEKQQTLNYDDIQRICARFIYLQTCTTIQDRINASQPGCISTFDIYVPQASTAVEKAELRTEAESDPLAAYLLRRIVRAEKIIHPPDVRVVDKWLKPQFDDVSRQNYLNAFNNLGVSEGESSPAQQLIDFETQYAAVIAEIEPLEKTFNQRASEQKREAVSDLDPSRPQSPLYKLREMPGATLFTLNNCYQDVLKHVDTLYIDQLEAINRLQQTAQAQRLALSEARNRFRYASMLFNSPFNLLVALTLFSFAAFLFAAGEGIWGIVVGLGGFILIRSAQVIFRGRRSREALRIFIRAQQDILQTQVALIEQIAVGAYLSEIRQCLSEWLRADNGETQVHQMIVTVSQLADRLTPNESIAADSYSSSISDAAWQQFAPKLTRRLWEEFASQNGELNTDMLRRVTRQLAHSEGLAEPRASETEMLAKIIAQMSGRLASALPFIPLQIHEDERNVMLRIAAFANWDLRLINRLQQDFYAHKLEPESLYHPKDPRSGIVMDPHNIAPDVLEHPLDIVSIFVRYNIPFSALRDISMWMQQYDLQCQAKIEDRYYMFRGLMHPTRAGVAIPDILRNPQHQYRSESFRSLPELAMVVAVLLHLVDDHARHEEIYDELNLFRRTNRRPIIDELSGALSENEDVIPRLLIQAEIEFGDCSVEEVWNHLMKRIKTRPPKFSEEYADWEIWIIGQLDALSKSARESDQPSRTRIAQLVHLLDSLEGAP